MSRKKDELSSQQTVTTDQPVSQAAGEQSEQEELYGWNFHKIPLAVAIVLTIIFYLFVFIWVE